VKNKIMPGTEPMAPPAHQLLLRARNDARYATVKKAGKEKELYSAPADLGLLWLTQAFTANHGNHAFYPTRNAGCVVALFERRRYFFTDDEAALQVGEVWFEPAPNLYAQFSVFERHEKERAVICLFTPNTPALRHAETVVEVILALQAFYGEDGNFIPGFGFVVYELLAQAGLGDVIDNARLVKNGSLAGGGGTSSAYIAPPPKHAQAAVVSRPSEMKRSIFMGVPGSCHSGQRAGIHALLQAYCPGKAHRS
jgi:hypothetical protein